jgi:antitoxin FitA
MAPIRNHPECLEAFMPSLSIKNVPEEVIERLRERATRNHRSLQGELLALVREAAFTTTDPTADARPREEPVRRGTKTLKQILDERLAQGIEARDDLPRAVDIVRADRDAR